MIKEFKLPELGENIASGTVAKVLISSGSMVTLNQPVLEVETDKAVAEIPSTIAGKVVEVRVEEGQSVRPGQVIFTIEEQASTAAEAPVEKEEPTKKAEETAASPVAAPKPPAASQPATAAKPQTPSRASAGGGVVLAAPSVRRMARELGVLLDEVPTSDPTGRVTAEDVRRYAEKGQDAPATPARTVQDENVASTPAGPAPTSAPYAQQDEVERVDMNAVRRKTAEHMTTCWTTIPHVTHFEKADITELEKLRGKYAKKVEAVGGRLTTLGFVIKVIVEALKKYPQFNASVDMANQQLLLKKFYNIGVAVDTPNGLLVPVVRDADKKSIVDVARELPELAQRARDRKLSLEEMQGGTFTITNLGGLGGVGFTPIINAPEVAILGLSRSAIEAVWQEGAFVPRTMLPLSLSYDHRVIDGADAARFMRFVAEGLAQPWTMYLGL